ncbi:MAG: hypothetical protein NTW25_05150 [Candidatus Kapabacteria bacterium]|nr:hypothetical protein [Candidatus Kapabacteria bacterium]
MKSKFIVFILFLIAFNFAKSEDESLNYLQADVKEFISELKKKDVDTICIIEHYTQGGCYLGIDDTSDYFYQTYNILWKKNNVTYFTKVNHKFNYSIIEIQNDEIWNFFFENKDGIKNETIKGFSYKTKVNNKDNINFIDLSPTYHENFKFLINSEIIEKDFNSFRFNKTHGSGSEITTNMNYDFNINLKSKLLLDKLDSLVHKIDTENLLTKKIK